MKYFCLLLFIFNCHAEEIAATSLGQGACWYQSQTTLKLSSFNDREATSISYEDLTAGLVNLIPFETKELLSLHLHCGSQGASFIARIKVDNNNLCLWAMLDHGKLKIRTLGGTLGAKKGESKLCDGFKQGELLVILKNHDYLEQLRSDKWSSMVKEIVPVAFNFYKLKLMPDYLLREEEVARILQENFDVSVEFNQFQHGIGEYVQLR